MWCYLPRRLLADTLVKVGDRRAQSSRDFEQSSGGYAIDATLATVFKRGSAVTLTPGSSVKTVAGAAAFITGQTTTRAGAGHRHTGSCPRGGLSIDDFGAGAADAVA